MFSVLVEAVLFALSGVISIGSISIVIILLLSQRGWRNGLGYAVGYTSAYVLIGILAVTLGNQIVEINPGGASVQQPILFLVLGVLLIMLALRNLKKPIQEINTNQKFVSFLDTITPIKAFGFGSIISVVNFKNLTLLLSAISIVIISNLSIIEKILITIPVVLVFCLSVIIPVFIYISFPSRSKNILSSFKDFLMKHNRPIGIWLPIIFGFLLTVKGLSDLL